MPRRRELRARSRLETDRKYDLALQHGSACWIPRVWLTLGQLGKLLLRPPCVPVMVQLSAASFHGFRGSACSVALEFLIIGSAKSGTSTLYEDLALHPELHLPDDKEPDILEIARNDADARELYRRHFAKAKPGQLCGDGSTFYAMLPDRKAVADMARRVCGDAARIVYIVRDPVERIVSHLAHDVAVARLPADDGDAAVLNEPRFIAWSDYPMQLRQWIEAFGADRILLIRFEHYIANRHTVASEVAAFVGVDPALLPMSGSVSNRRGSQSALRGRWLQALVLSRTYRFALRRMIPAALRRRTASALSRRVDVGGITLTPETRAMLKARFANQEAEIAALPVRKIGF